MRRHEVFVDTWAWIAASVTDDPDHGRATLLSRRLREDGALQLTSTFVPAEALTRLRYDASLGIALALADAIPEMVAVAELLVVPVDQPLWDAALRWFRRFDDQRFSFVDRTSFAIMAERGIQEALTADRHFASAGFTPLGA